MFVRHSDVLKKDNANCCYLCNECPQNFDTLQELQRHLKENHKELSSSTIITEELRSNVRNSFEDVNISMSNLLSKTVPTHIHPNSERSDQSECKCFATKEAMFLESLQNCASSFPLIAENQINKMDFRKEGVSCINSPTSSDFSSTETSGTFSTQMDYYENEEESKEKCAEHRNEIDLPELKIEGDLEINSNFVESTVKKSIATQRRYACTKCERIFARRDELNIHYTHTHRERPRYTCDVCEQVFMVKRDLSTHARIHNGEQPQRCDVCGKEYGTRQLLKKHSMVHTGVRSHFCPICPRAFYQKGHLTQHMHIHTGKRSHKCQLCVKTFIFKFDLNRHMKIHAERGGNSCLKCGKSFPKQSSLDEHILKCKKRCEAKASTEKRSSSSFEQHQIQADITPATPIKLSKSNFVGEKIDSTSNTFIAKLSPPHFLPNSPVNVEAKFFDKKVKPIASPLSANWAFLNAQNSSGILPLTLNPRFLAIQNLANLMISAAAARDGSPKFNFPGVNNNSFAQNAVNFAKLAVLQQQQQQFPPTSLAQNVASPLLNFAQGVNFANENSSLQNVSCDENRLLNPLRDQKSTLQQQLFQWSTLREGILAQKQQGQAEQTFKNDLHIQCEENTESKMDNLNSALFLNTKLIQGFLRQSQNSEDLHCVDSATTSSSSCASSPQKFSPVCYATVNGLQRNCEMDVRNEKIINPQSQFSSHAPATFHFGTKDVVEDAKNSQCEKYDNGSSTSEAIYNDESKPAVEISVDDIVDFGDSRLNGAVDDVKDVNYGEHQDEKKTFQEAPADTSDDTKNAAAKRCLRCGDVCTRECELERKLNAAHDEIMRLRNAAHKLFNANGSNEH